MITKLTKEQKKKIKIYQKKWHQKFHSLEFDEIKAKKFINYLYKLIDKKPPMIFILDSPMSMQIAINMLKNFNLLKNKMKSQLNSQLYYQLGTQLSTQLFSQLRTQLSTQLYSQLSTQLSTQLNSQLRTQLGTQLSTQLFSQLRTQLSTQLFSQLRTQLSTQLSTQLFSQLGTQLSTQLDTQLDTQLRTQLKSKYYQLDYWGDTSWYGYFAFYDFLYNEIFKEVKIKMFEEYIKLADSNIQCLVTFENIAFISKPPIFIKFNENNILHSKNSPAVEYSDGWKMYFIDGVYFDEELFKKTFKDKTITSEEIISIKNAEQKVVIIKEYGFEYIFDNLKDKKKIDIQTRSFNKNPDNLVVYELFEFSLGKTSHKILKVEWYEKDKKRQTVLGVPRNINDSIEAVAWTCFKTKEEWEQNLIKEA